MRFSRERFEQLRTALGLRAVDDVFGALQQRYAEPQRAYHTAQHIDECLAWLDHAGPVANAGAIELALWFHDAVYDPQASGNEERSAELAAACLSAAGASTKLTEDVRRLILITQHLAVPVAEDEKILTDIDLSILGAGPERFQEYERQVRQEYAWVPGPLFRIERTKILKRFLERPSIYATQFFRECLEEPARRNLRMSLEP